MTRRNLIRVSGLFAICRGRKNRKQNCPVNCHRYSYATHKRETTVSYLFHSLVVRCRSQSISVVDFRGIR